MSVYVCVFRVIGAVDIRYGAWSAVTRVEHRLGVDGPVGGVD